MRRMYSDLLTVALVAYTVALFFGILFQQLLLVDGLASAFQLTDEVKHAARVARLLVVLMTFLSLSLIVWTQILRSRMRNMREHPI